MTALMALVSALAVVLAVFTSSWFLLLLTFLVPAAFGAWLGLSNKELLAAFDGGDDPDPGRGTAGWTP